MKTYNEKDLNRLLNPRARIILTGSVLFSAAKDFVRKIASKIKVTSDKDFGITSRLNNYVEPGTKEEVLNGEIAKVENKQQMVKDAYEEVKSDNDDFKNKQYYLKNLEELYHRLENKRVSYQENGLGKFSLPKLVFAQFVKNSQQTLSKVSVSNVKEKLVANMGHSIANWKAIGQGDDVSRSSVTLPVNEFPTAFTEKANDNVLNFDTPESYEDDKKDNEVVYREIIDTFKTSLEARSKLEDYRREYKDIYKKALDDLTTTYVGKKTTDDDFIEEVDGSYSKISHR